MATDLDRSVMLKLERDLEHLTDRFDRQEQDGDPLVTEALETLRQDVTDVQNEAVALKAEVEELHKDLETLRGRFREMLRLVIEAVEAIEVITAE